jgi:hypothetical protein
LKGLSRLGMKFPPLTFPPLLSILPVLELVNRLYILVIVPYIELSKWKFQNGLSLVYVKVKSMVDGRIREATFLLLQGLLLVISLVDGLALSIGWLIKKVDSSNHFVAGFQPKVILRINKHSTAINQNSIIEDQTTKEIQNENNKDSTKKSY